jgi:hypothetical protein
MRGAALDAVVTEAAPGLSMVEQCAQQGVVQPMAGLVHEQVPEQNIL